jgi:hypothetical protein
MSMLRWNLPGALVLFLVLGCGSSGPAKHTVSGQVTFDGAPVPEGDIIFEPVDKNLAADGGKITDGRYSLEVKPGKHRVVIRASKLVKLPPGQKGAMGETEMHQGYIPARYNEKTELTADISGPRELDFTLKK